MINNTFNYYEKYLKYKNKYYLLKNKLELNNKLEIKDNIDIKFGGLVDKNIVLSKIKSIGFEFETNKMSPFVKTIDF